MPSLDDPTAPPLVKAMLIGDSKAGKTAALVSLVEAGYTLGILDMDCKINPSYFSETLRAKGIGKGLVSYVQPRDRYVTTGAGTAPKLPCTAFIEACRFCDKWEDGTKPKEWGPKAVLVIDTLNLLSQAAFNQAYGLNPEARDGRQWYAAAGKMVEGFLANLWDSDFKTNVLVLSHITDIELETEIVKDKMGNIQRQAKPGSPVKGFPTSIGQALSKHVAKYTNELWCLETTGAPPNLKRVIRTASTGRMDLGTAAPGLPASLPAEDGLAKLFSLLIPS
jgi:hypothetical protein